MALNRPSDFIPSHQREAVKAYITYDGQGRMWQIYEAPAKAVDGQPCLVTQYNYSNVSSTNIIGMKEFEGMWSGAWDF